MDLLIEKRKGNDLGKGNKVLMVLKSQGLVFAFLLILVGFASVSNDFLTANNIWLVLRQVSIVGVIACAITLVMVGGNFDLSVGSIVSFTTVLALTLHDQFSPVIALIIPLIMGLVIGGINGFFVGYLKMNSLITTLGMLSVVSALTLIYTKGYKVSIANPGNTWFSFIGRGYIWDIPVPVIVFGVTALILGIILKKTVYGRYIYAVGGNSIASQFSGIQARRVVFSTFILSGLAASMGGIMMASRLMSAQNNQGEGMELEVIAAVILGGTSLLGGSGSVYKTVIAVIILGFLQNGMILIGFPYYSRWIVTWIIIIAVVWFDIAFKNRR